MKLDFDGINARIQADSEGWVKRWLPDGEMEGKHWVCCNPRRNDENPSLKVNLVQHMWKDWGGDAEGNDYVSLYAYLFCADKQGDAAKELMAQLGMDGGGGALLREGAKSDKSASDGGEKKKNKGGRPVWTPIVPARPAGKPVPRSSKNLGIASDAFEYHTADGRTAGWVLRFDPPFPGFPKKKRKQFSPIVWARSDSGREDWAWKGFPLPWPLYNLHWITARPQDTVIVVEGEGKANSLTRMLPEYIATTAMHGAESPEHSDWSPLTNRDVVIWSDNDAVGQGYARFVAQKCKDQGCRVRMLPIPADWPAKYDAKDYERDGRPVGWLREALASAPEFGAAVLVPATGGAGTGPIVLGQEPWPVSEIGEFQVDTEGVWRDMGSQRNPDRITLRPIWVEALTENLYGAAGLMVKFYDQRWRLREYAFPLGRLSESGGVLGQELLTQMFLVVSGKEKWLSRYLAFQAEACTKIFRSVHRMGWVDSLGAPVFVLPAQILGQPETPLVYQPADLSVLMDCISVRGNMGGWQSGVAAQARGNPFLMFGILMGLASALLKPANVEMGGFHFYGLTTGGKTTLLQAAASVWGCGADPQMGPEETSVRKWHSTAAGFESTAEAHNDTLLCLDELEQAPEDELGRIVFLLAGGLSKSRSTAGGGLRAVKTWRVMICSSGEKSIRHQMGQAGKEYKGGKAVRLADIPVDGDDGSRAIFEDTHGKKAEVFGDDLKAACAENYGWAGPVFVAGLIADAMRLGWFPFCRMLREGLASCKDALKVKDTQLPPESARVLTRFALIMLAGRFATAAKIVDWPVEEVDAAVRFVRDRWLSNMGEERSEQDRALAHLRDAIFRNESRIVWLEVVDPENGSVPARIDRQKSTSKIGQVRDLIGFRLEDDYGFFVAGFRELCGEYDHKMVINALREKGLLTADKGKDTHKWPTIPKYNRPYLYTISAALLGEKEDIPLANDGKCPF